MLEDNTGFAPPYDTYRVTFENKAPEYIKIDYDGTLTWLGLPPWNYATKEPIPFVDAHLTFVDGSEAVIPFVYDINEYT